MNQPSHPYLFNFSSSFFGGGLKRITAYLDWFNQHGGAHFVLNSRLKGIENTYPANRYCFIQPHPAAKVLNYSAALNQFIRQTGEIELYYSYGIPLPYKPARVNWLHTANVLPFVNARPYVSFKRACEMRLLGFLLNRSIKHADIISAESEASLRLITKPRKAQLVVSVNGSDEEIMLHQHQIKSQQTLSLKNMAVAVGTCQYKCIDDVYSIYLHLREKNPTLTLVIAGIKEDVPDFIQRDPLVILRGVLPQREVCALLMEAKYYITATLIENSYNAASEGAFLAQEAFVSDIGPHRELLKNTPYSRLDTLKTRQPSLHVRRDDMQINHLKSWDQVIREMIETARAF